MAKADRKPTLGALPKKSKCPTQNNNANFHNFSFHPQVPEILLGIYTTDELLKEPSALAAPALRMY